MRFHPNDWFIAKNILFRRLFDKLRIRIQRINDWKRVYRSCINMSKLHGVVNLLCTTWKRERMGQPDLIVLGQPTVILRKLQRWLDAAKLSGHRGAGPGRAGVAVPVDKFWVPAGLAPVAGLLHIFCALDCAFRCWHDGRFRRRWLDFRLFVGNDFVLRRRLQDCYTAFRYLHSRIKALLYLVRLDSHDPGVTLSHLAQEIAFRIHFYLLSVRRPFNTGALSVSCGAASRSIFFAERSFG